MQIDMRDMQAALEASWDEETSYYSDEWTTENPAWGQCAVSSLVVQDYFGGGIEGGTVEIEDDNNVTHTLGHYWNIIDDSTIDTTWAQFMKYDSPDGHHVDIMGSAVRDKFFENQQTAWRYNLLKSRVQAYFVGLSMRRRESE